MASENAALLEEVLKKLHKLHVNGAQLGSASKKDQEQYLKEMLKELEKKEKESARKVSVREAVGLDLLFLLDVTVSMKPYRDGVVNEIARIVTYLEAMFKYSKGNIRVGVVGYRDIQLEPRFELLPFTAVKDTGVQTIKDWLGKLRFFTDKDNDFPEDVHGGLEQAASDKLGWTSAARTIIHIADAPGHGRRLTGPDLPWRDNFPDHDADGKELARLLTKLRLELKVLDYRFIHIVDPKYGKAHTTVMLQEFHKACGDPAWIQEVEWESDQEMALEVIAAASESIQKSVSVRLGAQPLPDERTYTLDTAEPDWNKVRAQPLNIFRHDTEMLGSVQTLLHLIGKGQHIKMKEAPDSADARIRIAPNPFAKGKNRLAYYGRYYPKGLNGLGVQEVVLKEFISRAGAENTAKAYKAQLEAQTVASFLAEDFNRHVAKNAGQLDVPEIRYAPCTLISLQVGRDKVRFLLMEPLILGEMVKFNNNFGAVHLADPQPHLQAFSHWSYEYSDKKLMVVDLQGFRTLGQEDDVELVLVDPAIHCDKEGYFTATNLAAAGGFEAFLHSHMSPTFREFELHGPICETLLPTCKEFRSWLHNRDAKQGRPTPSDRIFTGRKIGGPARFSAAPSTPEPKQPGQRQPGGGGGRAMDSVSSVSTTASIDHRSKALKQATKIHVLARRGLAKIGLPVPKGLYKAIALCEAKGVFKPEFAKRCHEIRKEANNARHAW